MTANSVNRLSGEYPDCIDGNNDTIMNATDIYGDCGISPCNQYRVEIAITLSLLVGIILVSYTIYSIEYFLCF